MNLDEGEAHEETQCDQQDKESQGEDHKEPDEIEVEAFQGSYVTLSETTKSASAKKLKIFEGLVQEEIEKKTLKQIVMLLFSNQ